VIGNRVEELRVRLGGEDALQGVELEPFGVDRDADDLRLETLEGHDGPQVGGRLDEHTVALVEEGFADELESLDAAAREHELGIRRPAALQPLEPLGDEVARPREPLRRRILERRGVSPLGELGEDLGDGGPGECGGIGKAAREGDDVLGAGERQDGDQALARPAARARGEERVPGSQLLLDRHERYSGQRGGRSSVSSAFQSSRMGAKTSTTTAPSGPVRTSCGVLAGMLHVAPGPSSRLSSPTRKTSDPRSTMPSCSFSCRCSGTVLPGSSSITPSVMCSPWTARPRTPSQIRWATIPSMSSKAVSASIVHGRARRAGAAALPVAVDDASAVQVVRGKLHAHAVTEEDPDPVAPHLAGRVAERLVPVVELDPEHPIAEGLDDLALHLDLLFLAGDEYSLLFGLGAPVRPVGPNRRGRRSGHDVGAAV
jgi:hypothetical protein